MLLYNIICIGLKSKWNHGVPTFNDFDCKLCQ